MNDISNVGAAVIALQAVLHSMGIEKRIKVVLGSERDMIVLQAAMVARVGPHEHGPARTTVGNVEFCTARTVVG